MENFSYPIKLEPLTRPAGKRAKKKRRVAPAQPAAQRTAEPSPAVLTPVATSEQRAELVAPEAAAPEAAGPAAEPERIAPERIAPDRIAEDRPAPAAAAITKTPESDARRAERVRRHLELKAERERNGVSLKAIADSTRIPLRHLEELERGDIDNWPVGVYAKSWARDYAKEAGIDPDRVMAMVAPVAEVEPTIEEIREVREDVERKRVDESPLAALVELGKKFAAVIVVLVLLVVAAVFFFRSDSRPANQSAPAPVGTTGAAPGQQGPQQPPAP